MPAIRRIYGYTPSAASAIFCDRLYPRGIRKETFAAVQWLKDIAPSAELRRWYHAAPQERFPEFAARYTEELQSGSAHAALLALKKQLAAAPDTVLLTAVRCPQQSHLSVLAEVLGWEKVDWGDGA